MEEEGKDADKMTVPSGSIFSTKPSPTDVWFPPITPKTRGAEEVVVDGVPEVGDDPVPAVTLFISPFTVT